MMKISLLRRMMSAKIRSNRGASLIFALLLFLVCTVIGSVVLAAGTASAGRMSKLGESDQRYYSVTSAAQLLAKELTDKEIRIVRACETTVETKYELGANDSLSKIEGYPVTTYAYETTLSIRNMTESGEYIEESPGKYSYSEVKKVTGTGTGQPFFSSSGEGSFLSERAVNYLFGSQNCNNDTAMGLSFSSSENEESGTFTMEHSNYNEILKIIGKYNVEKDGTIILTLWDDITGAGSQHFSLVITLQPEFDESERTFTDNTHSSPAPEVPSTGNYVATTVTTTVKTSNVSWKLGTITKNAAAT